MEIDKVIRVERLLVEMLKINYLHKLEELLIKKNIEGEKEVSGPDGRKELQR